jgi:pyruvate formate lyase activating enzyme
MLKEALLYEKLENNLIKCLLCSHRCLIKHGNFGRCGVRENINGTLFTHAYGEVIAEHIDPIEKKPLYHFLPGSKTYSIATAGCNFRCEFCQNWQISQLPLKEAKMHSIPRRPEEIVNAAIKTGCQSIAYTYTEPTIFLEYALETAKLAKAEGLANVFVSNGYLTSVALELIHPYLDAANIDLKSFSEKFYKNICQASLTPVLQTIELMHKLGIWIEITTLLIPGENDSRQELKKIANFIAKISPHIPWHISAFHPDYKFTDHPFTPLKSLETAQQIGSQAGLKHIHLGNV